MKNSAAAELLAVLKLAVQRSRALEASGHPRLPEAQDTYERAVAAIAKAEEGDDAKA